jgi:hypothetical protein
MGRRLSSGLSVPEHEDPTWSANPPPIGLAWIFAPRKSSFRNDANVPLEADRFGLT